MLNGYSAFMASLYPNLLGDSLDTEVLVFVIIKGAITDFVYYASIQFGSGGKYSFSQNLRHLSDPQHLLWQTAVGTEGGTVTDGCLPPWRGRPHGGDGDCRTEK